MFVVYYAPMQMLCDAPTAYEQYPDILSYLSAVPTVWDETIALDGKIGEYVIIARRKNKDWYIGILTNWTGRTVIVNFSFLKKGKYALTMYLYFARGKKVILNFTQRHDDTTNLKGFILHTLF